jgi:hypothetical protein
MFQNSKELIFQIQARSFRGELKFQEVACMCWELDKMFDALDPKFRSGVGT